MDSELFDMGTVSARGQIAIPSKMRKALDIDEGARIMFWTNGEELIIKKMTEKSWEQVTAPFRKASKKIKEDEVVDAIHKLRNAKGHT